jgi:hypothetical protein
MPALPLDEAGKYVAAAYVIFFALIVLYMAIIAAKVARIDRELTELVELAERDDATTTPPHGDPVAGVDPTPHDGEPVA